MKNNIRTAENIAYTGLAAASMTAVKLALSWLANVELVTLFVVFYVFALGAKRTLVACNIFVCVEIFIYGFAPWVVSYFIHWNILTGVIWLLKKREVKKPIFYALTCAGLTLFFGLQTTIVEVLFFSGGTDFLKAVFLRYFMGITFLRYIYFQVFFPYCFCSLLF